MGTTNIKNFTLVAGKNKLKITSIERASRDTRLYNAGMPKGEKYVYSLLPRNLTTGKSFGRQYIYADSKAELNKKIRKASKKNFKW